MGMNKHCQTQRLATTLTLVLLLTIPCAASAAASKRTKQCLELVNLNIPGEDTQYPSRPFAKGDRVKTRTSRWTSMPLGTLVEHVNERTAAKYYPIHSDGWWSAVRVDRWAVKLDAKVATPDGGT